MRVQTGDISVACSQTLAPYLRVVYDATYGLELAGAEERELGTVQARHLVDGVGAATHCALVPVTADGTVKMVAGGAITAFAKVYGADSGRVSSTANGNPIGYALTAASGAGSYLEVLRVPALATTVGGLVLFDDFLGDYPAQSTALTEAPWTKVETNGLGVTGSDQANGVIKLALDTATEAATAALYMVNAPFDVDQNLVFECRAAVYDKGDAAAVDINFGLAVDTHATDFDSIAQYAAFHVDGGDLSVKVQSKDGTTTVAATDTTVDLVDDTFATFKIDMTDLTDVKFYINGTRVLATTTIDFSAYSGTLTPIFHVEKTSDDSSADFRVDWVKCVAERA